jgi:hypothetical protein
MVLGVRVVAAGQTMNRLRRLIAAAWIGLLVFQYCGPRIGLRKLAHQLHGRVVFIVSARPLDNHWPSSDSCVLAPASPEEVRVCLGDVRRESPEGRYQILIRRWYHQSGLGTPFVARTTDTNEICHIRWTVTPQDLEQAGLVSRYPSLQPDQVIAENAYTFERFRRRGVQRAAARQHDEFLKREGYRWLVGYIAEDNVPNLRFNLETGSLAFERAVERHFLFRATRRTIERFEPPVPIGDVVQLGAQAVGS